MWKLLLHNKNVSISIQQSITYSSIVYFPFRIYALIYGVTHFKQYVFDQQKLPSICIFKQSYIQMSQQSELLSGLSLYQNHEYLSALRHFKNSQEDSRNPLQQMILETLTAVTNLQLCNYNEAALQFNELRNQISQWERSHNNEFNHAEVAIVKVKILANLMIIQLVNCDEMVDNTLQELIQSIEERMKIDKTVGAVLFRLVIKSLFGFSSFAQLEQELGSVLAKVRNNGKSKGNRERTVLPSSILLSSFAVYCHLSGKLQQAFNLEQASYEISKSNNHVPLIAAVLSLRHLEQLSKQLHQNKSYHQELNSLMSREELQGVAEETLFRNYNKKMDCACRVVGQLIAMEKDCEGQQHSPTLRMAVLNKLKRNRNAENAEAIDAVVELLHKDEDALDLMKDSQFVADAVKQHHQILSNFADKIRKGIKKIILRGFVRNLRHYVEGLMRPSRVIDINLQQMNGELSENNTFNDSFSSKGNTPSHRQKLPLHNNQAVSHNRSLIEQVVDSSNRHVNSQLSNNSRVDNRNKVYLDQPKNREKQEKGNLYKISKADPKQSNLTTKNNKVERNKSGDHNRKAYESNVISKGANREKKETQFKPVFSHPFADFIKKVQVQDNSNRQKEQSSFDVEPEKPVFEVPYQPAQPPSSRIYQPSKTPPPSQLQQPHPHPHRQLQQQSQPIHSFQPPSKIFQPQQVLSQVISHQMVKSKDSKKSEKYLENWQSRLRKFLTLCQNGQYIQKRHFSSDGGALRFLQLGKNRDRIFWGENQEAIDLSSSSSSSYFIQDIKGIVYGKITETLLKEYNNKLEPWKCFSLILKKRTFDVYCQEERDVYFWLYGLSYCLKPLNYQSQRYLKIKGKKRIAERQQESRQNRGQLQQRDYPRLYSVGRILWKRFLMRLQWQNLKSRKKEKRNAYSCANAYAIVVAAVRKMDYKLQKMKRFVV